MRVLFISKSISDEDRIRNELKSLCEGHSLTFCYSIDDAKSFIENGIVKHQIPLDLVITNNTIRFQSCNDFRDWIRVDDNRTYSKRDFNLNKIPIALIVDSNQNKRMFNNYETVIDDIGIDKLNLFASNFSATIRSWRKEVLDELDTVGIEFNSGIINYSLFFSENSRRNRSTRILSENFKMFPRKLNYYWLEFNKQQIEKSIDDFVKMLKKARRMGNKREEKTYHQFFNENKFFLLRDAYSKFWYEPRLFKKYDKYEEPDYTLKPNMSYQTDLSLLEVKLPNEAFMTNKKYHSSPRARLIQHIIQVNDYKDYLESDEYLSEINKVFGYIPKKINYNLLVGRADSKEEHLYEINKRMKQLGQGDLILMTYDELMEYQVKFLERMEILEIK